MEPENRNQKAFNQFLDSGSIKIPVSRLLRRNLISGVLLAVITGAIFYWEGSMPYIGEFSLLSALYATLAVLVISNIFIPTATVLGALSTYLLLSITEDIKPGTVFAAAAIGGNISAAADMHELLKEHTDISPTKIGLAFIAGTLSSFLIIGLAIVKYIGLL